MPSPHRPPRPAARHLPAVLLLALGGLAARNAPVAPPPAAGSVGFERAVQLARGALERGDLDLARAQIRRAQERDPNAVSAWDLRARWAQASGDEDERIYALHRELALEDAQAFPKAQRAALREEILALDPLAKRTWGLRDRFEKQLRGLADKYEKEGRRHSAIRVHKQILALDPDNAESRAAIERIASAPDPSLAGDAKEKDLLADVSQEWMADFDAQHATWDDRAKLERDNYVTYTDAGYEVMLRAGEAMEQMNAFYRQFFQYGTEEDGRSVPRIDLNIFKDRDEYLKLGIGPPVDWSAGHFTGNAVETYVSGQGGFEGMTGVLFHEAAHQFVSLATNAAGWLNEGLASYFEGCRILANGTVQMNLPANGRLFPLAERMEHGWMTDAWDGMDQEDPSKSTPEKAPTFRIVLENQYPWGPPWYAPTWGVVYFLYNYQDPWDGRFVYRKALREFIDKSGGRVGKGAVENFEKVVLANPAPPTPGEERPDDVEPVALPATVADLDAVWKAWTLHLRDEQSGRIQADRPYLQWARFAVERGDYLDAKEHFEKGLIATPDDPDVEQEFAALLADHLGQKDRATKLYLRAAQILDRADPVDERRLRTVERRIHELDPRQRTLEKVRDDIAEAARSLVASYQEAGHHMMAMDLAWRLGNDLDLPDLFDAFEQSVRASGKTLAMWRLAYDEESLDGWDTAGVGGFRPDGAVLDGKFGKRTEGDFSYRVITLNQVTSGDFSLEAEIQAERPDVTFAGIVFGRKSSTDFHAFVLFPPGADADGTQHTGFADLVSFYGDGSFDTWRHEPVAARKTEGSASERWFKLRVDVIGSDVDVWLDDQLVTTQHFASVEVLRGSFGLVLGTGEARFRNVRYLARQARDPGAAIERAVRLEKAAPPGQSANGSWLGQVPPFPEVTRWAQGERHSWAEADGHPQLLLLWSIQQNDVIPVDAWLRSLAEDYADVGLEFVSVLSHVDQGSADAYLRAHPVPGAVAIDGSGGEDPLGQTFHSYAIARFQLPRVVLLDTDGTVAWEGDPGFTRGLPWSPGTESYVRGPLDDLIRRRRVREVQTWRGEWEKSGAPALAAGDLETALPLLTGAQDLADSGDRVVTDAAAQLVRIQGVLSSLDALASRAESEGTQPAIAVLLDWGEEAELEIPTAARKALRTVKKSDAYRDWERALKVLGRLDPDRIGSLEGDALETARGELCDPLATYAGAFPAALVERARAAKTGAELAAVVRAGPRAPAAWLAHDVFSW